MSAVVDDLAAKHRALWALGDYAAIAADVVAPLGPELVAACGIASGDRVLDVAAGTGNAAIPAAMTGAHVVASDLCPELVQRGRELATQRGVELQWREANAEALPFEDAEFDVVMSCIGVMFAPHHQQAADELVRVCRPGGRIGLISWTPEGFIGQLFATMKPYVPAAPAGVSAPPLWGGEAYVNALLGDAVVDITTHRRDLSVDTFPDGAAFRDYFKANYGPTIAAYRGIADDPARVAALDADIAALGDRNINDGSMDWQYLLLTARKR
ncbi:class I SAM-dependent methyltransferase [Mycolicibacterium brisbanense]|uniref:Methyltransferase type 11 n=1 Tax=Mycolicibacterium brisbanense TaxID=146020 RepID=A0A117I616_9MYCO|nr:class I SAM-dependent methyltransferase [Mycolicibacterium brisbanense]MCV7155927.1 class I SAM-dependent methyltransferase [Mycolicibacterium brisbanense]GAS89430.1 methyltransferase type 11 [Mycolicibacterium brisbanense]